MFNIVIFYPKTCDLNATKQVSTQLLKKLCKYLKRNICMKRRIGYSKGLVEVLIL